MRGYRQREVEEQRQRERERERERGEKIVEGKKEKTERHRY